MPILPGATTANMPGPCVFLSVMESKEARPPTHAGTLLTARLALAHGLACNTAGGTHHAFPDTGSGFCILNDLAVTSEVLLAEGAVRRVLIVDLDVHQARRWARILPDACCAKSRLAVLRSVGALNQ